MFVRTNAHDTAETIKLSYEDTAEIFKALQVVSSISVAFGCN